MTGPLSAWPVLPDGTGFCVEHGVVWPQFHRYCPECGVPVLGAAVEKLREWSRLARPEDAPSGLPAVPPILPPEPQQAPWTPCPPLVDDKRCSKCGLKLENVMGYVCHNHPCPTGLGGPWCGVDRG